MSTTHLNLCADTDIIQPQPASQRKTQYYCPSTHRLSKTQPQCRSLTIYHMYQFPEQPVEHIIRVQWWLFHPHSLNRMLEWRLSLRHRCLGCLFVKVRHYIGVFGWPRSIEVVVTGDATKACWWCVFRYFHISRRVLWSTEHNYGWIYQ